MLRIGLVALPVVILAAGCSGPERVPASVFLDPGVRAAQERACAVAVARIHNTQSSAVSVTRTSSDPRNHSVVNARVGAANGYCRVTAAGEVVQVVF